MINENVAAIKSRDDVVAFVRLALVSSNQEVRKLRASLFTCKPIEESAIKCKLLEEEERVKYKILNTLCRAPYSMQPLDIVKIIADVSVELQQAERTRSPSPLPRSDFSLYAARALSIRRQRQEAEPEKAAAPSIAISSVSRMSV
jgi:hypothetical protein